MNTSKDTLSCNEHLTISPPSSTQQQQQVLKGDYVWVMEGKEYHQAEALCSEADRILIKWCWGRREEEWVPTDLVRSQLEQRSRRKPRFFNGSAEDNCKEEEENGDEGRIEKNRKIETRGKRGLREPSRKRTLLKRSVTHELNDGNKQQQQQKPPPKGGTVWVKDGKEYHQAKVLSSTPDEDGRILIEWCWGNWGEKWVSAELILRELEQRSRQRTRFYIRPAEGEGKEEENGDKEKNEKTRNRVRRGKGVRVSPRERPILKRTEAKGNNEKTRNRVRREKGELRTSPRKRPILKRTGDKGNNEKTRNRVRREKGELRTSPRLRPKMERTVTNKKMKHLKNNKTMEGENFDDSTSDNPRKKRRKNDENKNHLVIQSNSNCNDVSSCDSDSSDDGGPCAIQKRKIIHRRDGAEKDISPEMEIPSAQTIAQSIRNKSGIWEMLGSPSVRYNTSQRVAAVLPPNLRHRSTYVGEFFLFCHERQTIWERRKSGLQHPWTESEIMSKGRFCNVYRELDRGTAYFHAHVRLLRKRLADENNGGNSKSNEETFLFEVLWAALCYRLINRVSTFQRFGGIPMMAEWSSFHKELAIMIENKEAIFTNAHQSIGYTRYIATMKSLQQNKYSKVKQVAAKIVNAVERGNLQDCCKSIQSVMYVGNFYAWQVTCDLMESHLLGSCTENDWVQLGPGAKAGLNHLFGHAINIRPLELCKWLKQNQGEVFEQLKVQFHSFGGKEITLKNIEHCLCEYHKYKMINADARIEDTKFYRRSQVHTYDKIVEEKRRECSLCFSVGTICDTCGYSYCFKCVKVAPKKTCSWICGHCVNFQKDMQTKPTV